MQYFQKNIKVTAESSVSTTNKERPTSAAPLPSPFFQKKPPNKPLPYLYE